MLISFPKRFIYIKTIKTAGTTVEMYFEPWCTPPGTPLVEERPALVTEYGVVGARGEVSPSETWRNHLTARVMRPRIEGAFGSGVWRDSFRFCNVRNPYERMVSRFWMKTDRAEDLAEAPFDEVRRAFDAYCRAEKSASAASRHLIDGETVCHAFIRHERLLDGVEEVCAKLDIPFEPDAMGAYKSRFRLRAEPAREYFSDDLSQAVQRREAWEIQRFGYGLADAR